MRRPGNVGPVVKAANTLDIAATDAIYEKDYLRTNGQVNQEKLYRDTREAAADPDLWPSYDLPAKFDILTFVDRPGVRARGAEIFYANKDIERACKAAFEAR